MTYMSEFLRLLDHLSQVEFVRVRVTSYEVTLRFWDGYDGMNFHYEPDQPLSTIGGRVVKAFLMQSVHPEAPLPGYVQRVLSVSCSPSSSDDEMMQEVFEASHTLKDRVTEAVNIAAKEHMTTYRVKHDTRAIYESMTRLENLRGRIDLETRDQALKLLRELTPTPPEEPSDYDSLRESLERWESRPGLVAQECRYLCGSTGFVIKDLRKDVVVLLSERNTDLWNRFVDLLSPYPDTALLGEPLPEKV